MIFHPLKVPLKVIQKKEILLTYCDSIVLEQNIASLGKIFTDEYSGLSNKREVWNKRDGTK